MKNIILLSVATISMMILGACASNCPIKSKLCKKKSKDCFAKKSCCGSKACAKSHSRK